MSPKQRNAGNSGNENITIKWSAKVKRKNSS